MTKWKYFGMGLAIGYFMSKYKIKVKVVKLENGNNV